MELLQDSPSPMAENFNDHKAYSVNSSNSVSEGGCREATVAMASARFGSRILTQAEIECLQQSMEKALRRIGQESRRKNRLRIFRYYMPSLEEIKEHDEPSECGAIVDLTSLHKERAMNEGHYLKYSRSTNSGSRNKSRKSKQRCSY